MWQEKYLLGVLEMDREHQNFCEELSELLKADSSNFAELIEKLFKHAQKHFKEEEHLMLECGYSSYSEHKSEHDKILGELNLFVQKAKKGNTMMAKAYVKDRLPEWFELHLGTMDSSLAQKIKEKSDKT